MLEGEELKMVMRCEMVGLGMRFMKGVEEACREEEVWGVMRDEGD